MSRLVIVTATTNLERARPCVESWGSTPIIAVVNGPARPTGLLGSHVVDLRTVEWPDSGAYLGTVKAFALGVDFILEHMPEVEVIACLHDDLELRDPTWAEKVLARFDRQPAIGLLGFGGAIGLGSMDLYQTPYQPQQLARIGFRSNLVDAEVHGLRSLLPERVACLDGFSQVGRRAFWAGFSRKEDQLATKLHGLAKDMAADAVAVFGELAGHPETPQPTMDARNRPWHVLADLGMMHHFYDGALGCLAARYGWETWYLPIACRHLGGQTAVGDAGYQAWATQQTAGGDHGFWEKAHQVGYEAFRDVLPLRV